MPKLETVADLLRDFHTLYNGVKPADLPAETLEAVAAQIVAALDADRSPRRPYIPRKLTPPEKAPIVWDQPHARQAPVYEHSIICPICGQQVTISTHSPNAPAVCEREPCREAYTRQKNAERQKRYRENHRASKHGGGA